MKHASLLIALCTLFSLSAVAQSSAPEVTKTKRITITTKKTDDNGKTVTETWIAEGDQPEEILKEMSINPEMMQQVEVEIETNAPDQERLFLFRSAGDNVAIEATLDDDVRVKADNIVFITKDTENNDDQEVKQVYTWKGSKDGHRAYAVSHGGQKNSNCAALGVYANNRSEDYGATINRIIEKSGAEKAGLKQGDIIKKVEEFDVNDFQSLHFALANFLPGDEVNIDYMRDGKYMHTKAKLSSWSDIPQHEFRSRSDCDQPEMLSKNDQDEVVFDEPTSNKNVQPLALTDVNIYPNPNDGIFALTFTPESGPLSVTISDVNGKTVYKDQNVNAGGMYKRDINIADVPTGNYILSVTQGGKVYTQQISKQ